MPNRRQGLRAAFFASLIFAGGGSLLAQQPETVGPPVLKDFQLEGQRTTPPAQPAPMPTAPPATAPATTPPTATPSAERPAPRRSAPNAPPPSPARQAAPAAPVSVDPAPAETIATPGPAAPLPSPIPAAPADQAPVAAAPTAESSDGGWSWLWLALPFALGLVALSVLRRRRRDAADEAETAPSPAEQPPVAAAPPAPANEPDLSATATVRTAPAAARARLEIEFRPERAAATEQEAVVQFQMVLRNVGEAEAGNIRIDSRMFNAKDEREIETFLKGPIHEHSGSPQITIQPGDTLSLASAIKLPTSELREIELHGRRLFVPVAAINVAYDWAEGGKGRTSRSWVIGREADKPSEKMGGFRLDLGPRIYRSVGQRPTKLANVA